MSFSFFVNTVQCNNSSGIFLLFSLLRSRRENPLSLNRTIVEEKIQVTFYQLIETFVGNNKEKRKLQTIVVSYITLVYFK